MFYLIIILLLPLSLCLFSLCLFVFPPHLLLLLIPHHLISLSSFSLLLSVSVLLSLLLYLFCLLPSFFPVCWIWFLIDWHQCRWPHRKEITTSLLPPAKIQFPQSSQKWVKCYLPRSGARSFVLPKSLGLKGDCVWQ